MVFNPFWVYFNGSDPLGSSSEAAEAGWPPDTPLLSTASYEVGDALHGRFGVGHYQSYRDSELEAAILYAKRLGLKVMLKPMIDPFHPESTSEWHGSLDPGTGQIDLFMEAYARFMTHYATMAAAYGVDMLCVGCELNTLLYGPYPPPEDGTSGQVAQPNSASGFEMYGNYADRPVLESLWRASSTAPYSAGLITPANTAGSGRTISRP